MVRFLEGEAPPVGLGTGGEAEQEHEEMDTDWAFRLKAVALDGPGEKGVLGQGSLDDGVATAAGGSPEGEPHLTRTRLGLG